jgi:hypothetical protein
MDAVVSALRAPHSATRKVWFVSDSPLDLGAPEDSFRGLSKEEIDEQLSRNCLPTHKVVIEPKYPDTDIGRKRMLFEAV